MQSNKKVPLPVRAVKIIKKEGIAGFIDAIKRYFFWNPVEREVWYYLNRYLRPSTVVTRNVMGSKMILDLKDKGLSKDLFLFGCREPECTEIFKEELKEGMHVVDIGANRGYYTLIEAKEVGKSGKVYAVEPEPINFEFLKKNIKLNSYDDRVELHNLAIGDKTGEVAFEITEKSNLHKVALDAQSKNDSHIKVKMTTLDNLLGNKRVDYVRMDVEGYEWNILKGMEKMLSKNDNLKIFIEVHPELIKGYQGHVKEIINTFIKFDFNLDYLLMISRSTAPSIFSKVVGSPFPPEKIIRYKNSLRNFAKDKELYSFILNSTRSFSMFLKKS